MADQETPDQGQTAEAPSLVRAPLRGEVNRRGVLLGAWAICGAGLTGMVGALTRFLFPNVLYEPPQEFKAGFPNEYTVDAVDTRYKASHGVWIVRESTGFYVLSTVCTHLGCTPNWLEAEQKFKCPCHGSGFYKDGVNFEGPAPRPLERYAIQISDDGQLEVDKSRTFQEELGQWADSASFVTA